jgi:phosphate-selective porin OprO and OprP
MQSILSIARWAAAAALALGFTAPAASASVMSADTFKLRLSGRVQTLYQHSTPDAEADRKLHGDAPGSYAEAQTTSLLRIRRGRLVAEGFAYDPRLEYQVQLELAGASVSLKRAYLNYRLRATDVQLRAGKFKVPFGRQQLTSSFQQQLADRSPVSDEFARGDDDGVMIWGAPAGGRVEYYAGVFNGEGNNRNAQQDAANQWAGRLVWAPLGRFPYTGSALESAPRPLVALGLNAHLNGGWLHEVNGVGGLQPPVRTCEASGCVTDAGDDARVLTAGADVALRWRGLSVSAEVFRRGIDPRQTGLAERSASGWYAQAGSFLVPGRVEAGVRIGALDPDRDRGMDRVRETAPFVNYFRRGHDLKLQADYTRLSTEIADARQGGGATWLRERRLRLQLQFAFQPPR